MNRIVTTVALYFLTLVILSLTTAVLRHAGYAIDITGSAASMALFLAIWADRS